VWEKGRVMRLETFIKKDREQFGARDIEEVSIIEDLDKWLEQNLKHISIYIACFILGIVAMIILNLT